MRTSETFWVLIPKAVSETLELVGPQSQCYAAEPPIPATPALPRLIPALPGLCRLISATATSPAGLVYVNQWDASDYKMLSGWV